MCPGDHDLSIWSRRGRGHGGQVQQGVGPVQGADHPGQEGQAGTDADAKSSPEKVRIERFSIPVPVSGQLAQLRNTAAWRRRPGQTSGCRVHRQDLCRRERGGQGLGYFFFLY